MITSRARREPHITEDEQAAALLAWSGLAPSDPDERAGLLAAIGTCRAMSARVAAAELDDTAPIGLPRHAPRG